MPSFQFIGYDKTICSVEKWYIDRLNKEYNVFHFKNIQTIFIELEKNPFISTSQCNKIVDLYYKNLRLKWLLLKKMRRYRNRKMKTEPINKYLLDLTSSLEPSTEYIDLKINKNQFHRFSVDEMIQLFEFSLYNQEEGIPDPFIPNNPYTGSPFTFAELIHIFNSIKKTKPLIMNMFKECSFSIDNMLKLHKIYLVLKSSEHYIYNIDDREWFSLFNLYYNYEGLKDFTCKKCMLNIPQFRIEFSPILVKYIFESNIDLDELIEPSSIKMCIHFIDYYKIPYGRIHAVTHRKILKVNQEKKCIFRPVVLGETIQIQFSDYNRDDLFVFRGIKNNIE